MSKEKKEDKKEVLNLLNSYIFRTLEDIKKKTTRVQHHPENELKLKNETVYGLGTLIDSLEGLLKRLKKLEKQANKINRELLKEERN